MIAKLLIATALAQPIPFPNEIQASNTCQIILDWYVKEKQKENEKLVAEGEECRRLQTKLPKKYQNKLVCPYPWDSSMTWVNHNRFNYECSKILGKLDVKEHAFGPIRVEDHCRMNPWDRAICGESR